MPEQILITGGAGFIGSHVTRRLLSKGYRVRLLDNLTRQVHGPEARRPTYLEADAELTIGDVRDPEAVRGALRGCDAVVHLAARVGVGQSMYEITDYTDGNTCGTAVLFEALIQNPVKKLVVASSMSIYGEGLYRAPKTAISAARLDGTRVDVARGRRHQGVCSASQHPSHQRPCLGRQLG